MKCHICGTTKNVIFHLPVRNEDPAEQLTRYMCIGAGGEGGFGAHPPTK